MNTINEGIVYQKKRKIIDWMAELGLNKLSRYLSNNFILKNIESTWRNAIT